MKLIIYFFILSIFICSCTSSSETEHIQQVYSNRNILFDDNTKFCLVLPEAGCSGCISGMIYHIRNNIKSFSHDQRKNLIVFTAINSNKMLLRNMQIDSLNQLNCIVDRENKYLLDSSDRIYPIVLIIQNGKIKHAEIQSPDKFEDVLIKNFNAI